MPTKYKSTYFIFAIFTSLIMMTTISSCSSGSSSSEQKTLVINPSKMDSITEVDPRYQSYNVEMVEVVGGSFWKPYRLMDSLPAISDDSTYDVSKQNNQMYRKLSPIDLTGHRLLTLAKGLAPAYVRVSGTWANGIYFEADNQTNQPGKTPAGFVNVLTAKQWKGVLDFLTATDSKLVTSFTVSNGVRDKQGVWTPVEAQKILEFTKAHNGQIAAAELFNEPTMPTAGGQISKNYNGQNYANDMAAFNKWAKAQAPGMLVLGPGSVGEGSPTVSLQGMGMQILATDSMLSASPKPTFDVFSYHYYGAASVRMMRSGPFSIKAAHALDADWLRKTDTVAAYYGSLRDKYEPGKPLWITETAQAAAGGDAYAATYLDCFRYLYQLGSLAEKGVKVIMHNTLAASEYSLTDQDTHLPKPNYWAAYLWAHLMGTTVLDASKGISQMPGVYVFAQSQKDVPNKKTLLILNTNKSTLTINLPSMAKQYTLTSSELQGSNILLNGHILELGEDDALPEITGKDLKGGPHTLPAYSISFITL